MREEFTAAASDRWEKYALDLLRREQPGLPGQQQSEAIICFCKFGMATYGGSPYETWERRFAEPGAKNIRKAFMIESDEFEHEQ